MKAKYPEIALVSAAGPSPADPRFHLAWQHLRELHADIIDEHSYALPDWFYSNTHRYDGYDRNGPKVFMGEYAAQSVAVVSTKNRNNLDCALAEAAYLTGLERNAEVVRMASYAPLFANTEAWQWTPDLIWVDSLRVLRTPSYHVQSLYAQNRGDRVLPAVLGDLKGEEAQRLYATAAFDAAAGEVILKLVNATAAVATVPVDLAGVRQVRKGSMTILQGDLSDENTMDSPDKVAPYTTAFSPAGPRFEVSLPAHSFSVVRLGVAP